MLAIILVIVDFCIGLLVIFVLLINFLKGGDIMGSFGGFYKGDKKKQKKTAAKNGSVISTAPVFVMPKMVEKKRKTE